MATKKPRHLLHLEYEEAAQAYLHMLRTEHPEHFMEATPQATQRKITLESLDLVSVRNPAVQHFNELLVQYPYGRPEHIRQVVPDNMVVVHSEPLRVRGSYNVPLQPVGPFWVLEYVSKENKRKDYEDSFVKYERELKVPYYLLFYPDNQELTLFRHTGRKYRTVTANEHGRHPIPPLDLEVAMLDGWVRYWYKGELLPLPADLLRNVEDLSRQLRQAHKQTRQVQEQVDQERRQKERLLAQLRELGIEPRL
jgi:Uma2 family endonuclease